jgi:hypothetical protein
MPGLLRAFSTQVIEGAGGSKTPVRLNHDRCGEPGELLEVYDGDEQPRLLHRSCTTELRWVRIAVLSTAASVLEASIAGAAYEFLLEFGLFTKGMTSFASHTLH